MPRKDEIDRMIVLLYRSNNSQGYINFSRPIDWLDKLPMKGLEEFQSILEGMVEDVRREIVKRNEDGIEVYSREWAERENRRAELTRLLGFPFE